MRRIKAVIQRSLRHSRQFKHLLRQELEIEERGKEIKDYLHGSYWVDTKENDNDR